ncbi:DeoR/GlpR family DNA-binding transcription regulator [Corynebacterium kozikiae]|uniref:DeoR/GlpR family DNA-binding transcription regulator n=1 Tax=Corynebacterium kozikiae TaxID=2968469 RepID=UPI00211CE6CB|nr:DeoR/GlpR family DNA-binding transcription regulator [Corynebacterium sp. 76QC2CO]MCQ9342461.1 DeoR/GlpR family DNA-binding transcription regulator [Corynebacterium sp. 76QC2CO]
MATVEEVANRQSTIVALTQKYGRSNVSDLAAEFNVTPETIRRDLKALEQRGHIRRVHGGAVIDAHAHRTDLLAIDEEDSGLPLHQVQRRKQAIAEAAMHLIPGPQASMFIDAGSTTEAFANVLARYYVGQQWVVVTNSPNVARTLVSAGVPEVTILGGVVKSQTQAVVGPRAVNALQLLRADVAFMGTSGLTTDDGLTTSDPREAAVKTAMIERCRTAIVLCDSTKIGKSSTVTFAPLSKVHVAVTDRFAPADFTSKLKPFHTKVVIS